MTKQKTGRATSTARGLILGLGVSMLTTLIAAVILAKTIEAEIIPWENTGYIIVFILIVGTFLGAYTSCQKIKRQKLMISILSGLIYWVTLISVTALFYGGQYETVAITGATITVSSFAAFLVTSSISSHTKTRRHKIRPR